MFTEDIWQSGSAEDYKCTAEELPRLVKMCDPFNEGIAQFYIDSSAVDKLSMAEAVECVLG